MSAELVEEVSPLAKYDQGRTDPVMAAKDMRAALRAEMGTLETEVRTIRAEEKFVVRLIGGWADDCFNFAHILCGVICDSFNDAADEKWKVVVYDDRFR